MKKKLVLMAHILVAAAALHSACAAPTPETVEEIVSQVVEEEVGKDIVPLEVSVGECPDAPPDSRQLLDEAIDRAANDLGEERDISIEITVSRRTLKQSSGCTGCQCYQHAGIPESDLFLLDSPSTLHAFLDHKLVAVPDDILESVNPFAPSVQAFTHPDGQVLGLAQATASLMTIYNPDELGELPEWLSWDEMFTYVEGNNLALPAHSCVVIAAFQSAAGDDLTEDLIFQGDYRELLSLGAPIIDGLSPLDDQLTQGYDEMVERFFNQDVALVLGNTEFLVALAKMGYEEPVATTRFPVLNHPGGAAHTVGWVVPATSSNPDLAWALAEKLARDPSMLQWGLANGMAPANQASFETLMEDPSLATGLLPEGLFHDFGLTGLLNSTAESKAWRVPSYVPIEDYNEIFLPGGNMLASAIANDKIQLEKATDLLEEVRTQLELRYDPEAFFDLGMTYYDIGDYDRAIVDFDQAILLDPEYAEAYYSRGVAYAELGKQEDAILDLEMALELGLEPSLEQEAEKLLEELE